MARIDRAVSFGVAPTQMNWTRIPRRARLSRSCRAARRLFRHAVSLAQRLASQRIAEQEPRLELLTKQRDGLFQKSRDRPPQPSRCPFTPWK
jgi:hypothetical protein